MGTWGERGGVGTQECGDGVGGTSDPGMWGQGDKSGDGGDRDGGMEELSRSGDVGGRKGGAKGGKWGVGGVGRGGCGAGIRGSGSGGAGIGWQGLGGGN